MATTSQLQFGNLIDLANRDFGGKVLEASDDFFASKDNLINPHEAIWDADRYTDDGKWMDGWESRRKRSEGYDWCVVELGMPGQVSVVDIDTAHFLGNHPPFASLEGALAPEDFDGRSFDQLDWVNILETSALGPGRHNYFAIQTEAPLTHLRLNIYPDGGVARLRVFGKPVPLGRPHADDTRFAGQISEGAVDLVALRNGGKALACSDMFFGTMDKLLAPGRGHNMSSGWETKRKRERGHDWVILEAGTTGTLEHAVIDTQHFKGNPPAAFSIEGIYAPGLDILTLRESDEWRELMPRSDLKPHDEAVFAFSEESRAMGVTHIRFNIYPDGGVSRLRLFGRKADT